MTKATTQHGTQKRKRGDVVVFLFVEEIENKLQGQRIPILACLKLLSSVCSIYKYKEDMRASLQLDPDEVCSWATLLCRLETEHFKWLYSLTNTV